MAIRLILVLMAAALAAGCTPSPSDADRGDGGGSDGGADPSADANPAVEAICGNGVKEPGEACDDGNNLNGDGCNSVCAIDRDPAAGKWIIVEHECKTMPNMEGFCDYEIGVIVEFINGCLFHGSDCVDGYDYEYESVDEPGGYANGGRQHTGTYDPLSDRWQITISIFGSLYPSMSFTYLANEEMTLERVD
jgi:cysteine-rich repeat protein